VFEKNELLFKKKKQLKKYRIVFTKY